MYQFLKYTYSRIYSFTIWTFSIIALKARLTFSHIAVEKNILQKVHLMSRGAFRTSPDTQDGIFFAEIVTHQWNQDSVWEENNRYFIAFFKKFFLCKEEFQRNSELFYLF